MDRTAAEQVTAALNLRNAKARSVRIEVDDTGTKKVLMIPFEPNTDGFYYDNYRRKFVLGIDPAGNILPVILSTNRDPLSPSMQESQVMRAREQKGWMWLERRPYGFTGDWDAERVRVIEERRAAHAAKARPTEPSQLEQLAAVVENTIRPAMREARGKGKHRDEG